MLMHAFYTHFIKIKLHEKHDNIGSGPISLPPMEMHTSATWYTFDVPAEWTGALDWQIP